MVQSTSNTAYATETRKARRKTGLKTQEFFTPDFTVNYMCDKVTPEEWGDPTKTFLEPSFGNGNFLVEMLSRRLDAGVDWKTALETLYGVELMKDNVQETYVRLFSLMDDKGITYDYDTAYDIMRKNLVCSDFFKWDFENWCPIDGDTLF